MTKSLWRTPMGPMMVLALLSSSLAWGQATTSLRGTVSDPSGAVIPNAKAILVNTATFDGASLAKVTLPSGIPTSPGLSSAD